MLFLFYLLVIIYSSNFEDLWGLKVNLFHFMSSSALASMMAAMAYRGEVGLVKCVETLELHGLCSFS